MRKLTLFAILSVLAALFVACDDSSSGASNADEHAEAISSESAVDEGTSSAEDAMLYSSNADDEGTSSNTEDAFGESSSSEVIQENLSSEVNENFSSEVQSSSSETQSSSSENTYTIYNSRTKTEWELHRYKGDTAEVQEAGRFRITYDKQSCQSIDIGEIIEEYGIVYWSETCPFWTVKGFIDVISTKDIKKIVLDSLIDGFFNSYTFDDTSKIEIEFDPRDWQETVRICDEEKNCHYETIEKDTANLGIYFWGDVSAESCLEIVKSCGAKAGLGDSIALERECPDHSLGINAPKSSIDCLESHRDIKYIETPQYYELID